MKVEKMVTIPLREHKLMLAEIKRLNLRVQALENKAIPWHKVLFPTINRETK